MTLNLATWLAILGVLGLENGIATTIITEASVFEPIRHWLTRQAGPYGSPYESPAAWLCELVNCPLCVSIWTAGASLALALAVIGPDVALWRLLIGWSLGLFAVAAIGHAWRHYIWT
jgi:hypothetical protein